MKKEDQQKFISDIYNLILLSNIKEEERSLLINFKNDLASHNNFDDALYQLSYDLQQLSVKNITNHTHMSPKINDLYMRINSYRQNNINLAKGISSIGIWI